MGSNYCLQIERQQPWLESARPLLVQKRERLVVKILCKFTNLVSVHLCLKPISTSDATMASHIKYKFCTGEGKKKENNERKLNLMMKILQFFSNSIKFNNMGNKMRMITVFSKFLLLLSLLDSVTKRLPCYYSIVIRKNQPYVYQEELQRQPINGHDWFVRIY